MRLIAILLGFILFASLEAKRVTKVIRLKDFPKDGPFIFITKMLLSSGDSKVDITYYKNNEISSESLYNDLAIAMVNQTQFRGLQVSRNCQQKEMRIYKKEKFHLRQERTGMKHFKVFDLPKAQMWYFYIYSCRVNLQELVNNDQQIKLQFSIVNNGSHFQQNDHMLTLYIVVFVLWLLLVIRFAVPLVRLLSLTNPSSVKVLVYGGLVVLGAAYLYRLIHLLIYWGDGSGVHIFQVFYLVLKNIGEAVITTVLVSIAWGWTIVHLKPDPSYVIVGIVSTLINVVSLVLASLTQQHEYLHHIYDTVPGIVVLVLRLVILFIFWLGIMRSLRTSSGHVSTFLRKLNLIGGIYLISWPLTVLLVETLLPTEHHRNVITFVEELSHLCGCTLLCTMISYEESAYRKVSLHEDDNPLGMNQYKKR